MPLTHREEGTVLEGEVRKTDTSRFAREDP